MYKLQPMLQRDSSFGNSPFATSKKFSPYSNYRQHISRSQSLGGKGCSTVRSNGKTLERFHAEQNLNSFGIRNSYFGEKQRQNGRRSPEKENEFVKGIDPFVQDKNSRYKTEICRNFKERSNCIYGDQCQFAHGRQELRDAIRNNKYKTKSCQKYWVTGYCAYGPRCNFLHYESDEPYESKSPSKLDSNQPMIGVEQPKLKPSLFDSERENKSPSSSKSEEELAETVEEVISAGRGILDKMEKDKIDPSLEDLFMKLKRALPAKRNSPPIVELTSKFNEGNKFDIFGASPMTIERNNEKKVADGFYSSNLNNRSSTASNNSVAIHGARPLTSNTFGATESLDYPKCSSKDDIFNWIDTSADKVHDGRTKQKMQN